MEHVCSSRQDQCLFIDPNIENNIIHEVLNSNHEQEPPLFLDFPSPYFDGISTPPINTNLYHITSQTEPVNITEPSPSESKRIKKRSGAKKDRHSKIHTAQGLRDRRIRLSLNIARKFFKLQDLLGFDKASKTIEWLFCKSNKAIKEVAENYSLQHTNQTQSINNSSIRETREKARARARDRTRERLVIKDLEKSKLGGNPKEEIYKLGFGYLANPNNHNGEELGFISSTSEPIQQESSSSNINILNSFDQDYSGSVAGTSTNYCPTLNNHNPPAGWLNSWNGFLPGEWDADSFATEYYNYGIVPTNVSGR